jgi:crossover junction endodeoxyribonuclease RuvC
VTSFTAIGVDPGLARTGFAVIEVRDGKAVVQQWDAVATDCRETMPRRLHLLFDTITGLLKEWRAEVLVVEDVFFLPKYPKAAMQLGAVHGILNLAAAISNVRVLEMKPTEVKRALTGNGRAPKAQVEQVVRRMCALKCAIKPDHASDALALAVVGLSRLGVVKW